MFSFILSHGPPTYLGGLNLKFITLNCGEIKHQTIQVSFISVFDWNCWGLLLCFLFQSSIV